MKIHVSEVNMAFWLEQMKAQRCNSAILIGQDKVWF